MKGKKIKIIIMALICAGLMITIGSFVTLANDEEDAGNDKFNKLPEKFREFNEFNGEKDAKEFFERNFGEFGEFDERPEKHERFSKDGGFGFGFGICFGIDGVQMAFGSDDVSITDILGITEEELKTKIEENRGNIFKILEDAGKLDEYKTKLLENFKSHLDRQVADGKITQDKANELYASMEKFTKDLGCDENGMPMLPRPPRFDGNDSKDRTDGPVIRKWDGTGKNGNEKVTVEAGQEAL